jgi:hypothetical protein
MPHIPETKVPTVLVEQTIEYKVYKFCQFSTIYLSAYFDIDIFNLIFGKILLEGANAVVVVSSSMKDLR